MSYSMKSVLFFSVLVVVTSCTEGFKSTTDSMESASSGSPTPPGTQPGRIPVDGDYQKIASNFNVPSELVASWGTGAIAGSAVPDVVGAFRFICNASHELYDDPIVYPGQPGKSHLHQFFGNTLANASSTYESLRQTGMSTCNSPLNRSAYWIPAMMNGQGKVIRPDFVSIYYKRLPKASSNCTKMGKDCVDLPRGLRMVFGKNMNGVATDNSGPYFNCDAKDRNNVAPGTLPGHYPSIIEAAKNCPTGAGGNRLGAIISSPSCWDGVHLDSADHRSHLGYPSYGNWGYLKCPSTHPYVIPTFTLAAWYTVDSDLMRDVDGQGNWTGNYSGWHLSSDEMNKLQPGSTMHADWFGAWDDDVMQLWTDNCINKLLSCTGGDLGNGQQLKMFSGFTWEANPRLVDLPPVPMMNHSKMSH